jgi:general secretion pathway protein L
MATRILGVDLGAYSVKVAVANPGFRHAIMADYIERRVPEGDEPHEVRATRVLGEIIREYKLETESPYCAIAGDHVFVHILEFPFKSLKRSDLERAVGAELESILPIDLEDMAYSFEILPQDVSTDESSDDGEVVDLGDPLAADEDDPTFVQGESAGDGTAVVHGRVAEPTTGMRILACAMRRDWGRRLLGLMGDQAAEPRGMVAAPASYTQIAERISEFAQLKHAKPKSKVKIKHGPPVAIIDIGHERTDVCVVQDGRAVFTRTLARGGRDVTESIATAWHKTWDEAETAKHTDGFVGSSNNPPPSEAWMRVHEVVVKEMTPLARDLRQTLNGCRAKTGARVTRAVLIGGGSRLRGIDSYLAEQLRVPVELLDAADGEKILGTKVASMGVRADVACLAAGVAFEGGTGKPSFDLRQGALAYKADLGFLRQRATQIAAAALIIVAFAAVNAYAALYKLRKQETTLNEKLAVQSTAINGSPMTPNEVTEKCGVAGSVTLDSPLPKMTAYDILLDISTRLPDRKKVTINVSDLDIKQGKITLKGSAASNEEIDLIEEKIKEQPCLKDLTRGPTTSGPEDTRNFSFTIKSTCM